MSISECFKNKEDDSDDKYTAVAAAAEPADATELAVAMPTDNKNTTVEPSDEY